jgi:Domain of unknown function (DUF5063)
MMNHVEITRFAETARGFCGWFEGSEHSLPSARSHLLQLLFDVAGLPEPHWPEEHEPPRRTREEWEAAFRHTAGFAVQFYRTVLAPLDLNSTDEPVLGHASDDLADIYFDLRQGFSAWDRGQHELAATLWKFHYLHHWGQHAVSLLKAVNEACPAGRTVIRP